MYLHVPFCRRLCWFCACRTQGTQNQEHVAAYLETLKAELGLLANELPKGVSLSKLHWGGGTPTILSPEMITELAQMIGQVIPFCENAEFSVEIDPNEIDESRLDSLARAGMTRAVIGVQDFDPNIQKVIGRVQDYETAAGVVDMIRSRGIRGLNADILYGLPFQTSAHITDSAQKLLSLNPDRIALYGYSHVPWMARRQSLIPSDSLPTPQERLDLFETARRMFVWDNYDEIGTDHFAVPGDALSRASKSGQIRRNFQGYTDDTSDVLIGLGASSISRFPQGYAQNAASTSLYTGIIRGGQFATVQGHTFQGQDLLRGRMIETLMCNFSIDTRDMCLTFGANKSDLTQMFSKVNETFGGILNHTNDGLLIPPAARPLTRLIARSFDQYELSKPG